MASIQSLGVGSGLLTSELVDDIIAAEREATDLRLQAKQAEFEARISAFGTIQSGLDALRSTTASLSSSLTLLTNTAASTNEGAVTATATTDATPGVHSVEVLSLARAHTLASLRFDDIDSVVGDGTLDFRFGTTTFSGGAYDTFTENPERASGSVVIDSANNTLTGVRDAINEAGLGVSASILNDGDGYLLVLTSEDTGADNSMEITVTEGATPGLSALSFNAGASTPGTHLTQTVVADDAVLRVDGINVTRDNNTFDEVIEGVTFNALGINAGAPATITVSRDTSDMDAKMQAFVDAFNALKTLTDDLTAFDEDAGTGSLLTGDATLRGVRSQMRRFLSNMITGVSSTEYRSLVDIGLTTNQNANFALEFDSAAFQAALSADAESVVALLADQSRASDDLIRFEGFQPTTEAGSYDVEITDLATHGDLLGATTPGLAGATIIDPDNNSFTVVVDGVTSALVELTQKAYADSDELAAEIELQINNDANLEAAERSVSVIYNATDQRFEITSNSFGSTSQVGIESVDTNVTADLGLAVATGETRKGSDVAGTINGIAATGAGQFLSVPVGAVAATSGFFRGDPVAGFDTPPLTLDGSNNSFVVAVDGIQSGAVLLTEQDYATGEDLATEIQARINADATLAAAGVSVSVGYDAVNKRFTVTSDSDGSKSLVNFVNVPAGTESALGFTVAAGEPGRNATTVSDAAGGLQLQILGGTTGYRGTATLVRGAMNQLDRYIDSVLEFGGTLDNKVDSLEAQLENIEDESAAFNTRMDLLTDRLRTQFAAADALISKLNSTSQFLDQQLAALPLNNRDE